MLERVSFEYVRTYVRTHVRTYVHIRRCVCVCVCVHSSFATPMVRDTLIFESFFRIPWNKLAFGSGSLKLRSGTCLFLGQVFQNFGISANFAYVYV